MQRGKKGSTKVYRQLFNRSLYYQYFKLESFSSYNMPNGVLSSFYGGEKQREREGERHSLEISSQE